VKGERGDLFLSLDVRGKSLSKNEGETIPPNTFMIRGNLVCSERFTAQNVDFAEKTEVVV